MRRSHAALAACAVVHAVLTGGCWLLFEDDMPTELDAAGPIGDGGVTMVDAGQGPEPAPACNGDGWCWERPRPHAMGFGGVHFLAPDHGWAVAEAGMTQRWDGRRWMIVPSTAPSDLHAVHSWSRDGAWAVGAHGAAIRWDGAEWRCVSTGSAATLRSVWAHSADVAWAVGDGGAILRWDGESWRSAAAELERDGVATDSALLSVAGRAPNDVWVVGDHGRVLHWDGARWTRVTEGVPEIKLWDVELATTGEVWLAASGGQCALCQDYGVLLVGGAPGFTEVDRVSQQLFDLALSPAGQIWATGECRYGLVGGALERMADCDWTLVEGSIGERGIAAPEEDGAWAVGARGIARWTGSVDVDGWQEPASPAHAAYRALAGSADGRVLWVVASNWADDGRLLRYDGSEWSEAAQAPYFDDWFAIWAPSGSEAWLLHSDGVTHWPEGTATVELEGELRSRWARAIHGSGPDDVWVVGGAGASLRFNGTEWSRHETDVALHDVWSFGPTDAIAVGEDGAIRRFDGTRWSTMESPTEQTLRALWGRAPGDAWAVGDGGTVVRLEDGAWRAVELPTELDLWSVWGSDTGRVAVAGEGSALWRWSGTRFARERVPSSGGVVDLWAPADGDPWWALTARGVLRSTPGAVEGGSLCEGSPLPGVDAGAPTADAGMPPADGGLPDGGRADAGAGCGTSGDCPVTAPCCYEGMCSVRVAGCS